MYFSIFQQNPAVGKCDETCGNKQDFKCAPDSDDWVEERVLDDYYPEFTTLSKSPKRDDYGLVYNIKSILDSIIPPFFKGNSSLKFPQPRSFDTLKIDQRVVTFLDEGIPLRGTVRYTGDVEDSSGQVHSFVGLELVGIILIVMDTPMIVFFSINPLTAELVLRALIDFTLSNARRFYSSMGNPLAGKGLNIINNNLYPWFYLFC